MNSLHEISAHEPCTVAEQRCTPQACQVAEIAARFRTMSHGYKRSLHHDQLAVRVACCRLVVLKKLLHCCDELVQVLLHLLQDDIQ